MRARKFLPLLVIAAGLLAYHNSFTGAFVDDDLRSIPENPTIRHLWPIWEPLSPPHSGWLTVEGRPLINLSLAINYALGGYNVWGYHAFNLTIHILAGLTLLGIVRRTLLQPPLRNRFGAAADELALAVAVLWTVHPLQTEAVTYVIQRAESIMGLFYLLTLYCFIRGTAPPPPRAHLWYALSVVACALGMASKEVMVSAPLLVLLYDRAFVSGSFRELWRRRWLLYVALTGTWVVLGFMVVSARVLAYVSTERQHFDLSWREYLATEPGVILYYLRLSVWPSPLCMNHPWPIARTWMSILPPALVMAVLLGATAWAWRRNPVWGFAGAWFFLILAPSSSFIPLHDVIYEHRMYLPLAAVVSLVVMGLYSVMGRRSLAVFVAVAISLGFLTWRRNQDYRSEIAIRADAVARFPNQPRAHYNLGDALLRAGRVQEAVAQYEQAVRIQPDYAAAHNNLGFALMELGQVQDAIRHFQQALRINPDFAEAHYNLGVALMGLGQVQDAIRHFQQALRIKPDDVNIHYNLANILMRLGRLSEAIAHYEQALRIKPDFAEAHSNLGFTLEQVGRLPEAIAHYEQALRIKPDYAEAQNNLGIALVRRQKVPEAVEHFQKAVQIKPDFAEAHYNLGGALEQLGRVQEAATQYEQALRLKPDFAAAQTALARLRASQ
ncbi:MAG TPA: tetratricopeptide repeat protein [Verrucomicrobiae bacterium]|nr:tetratricopeptide repeat protein [Verrucomicrobiae bacterium]